VLWIDQAEEVPDDVIQAYVPARLSQVGFPHEVWYTPNPPGHGHFFKDYFPEDNHLPHRTYIRTSVYDNRKILGDEYIAGLERAYPVGSVLRRRFIEGKRGLNIVGKPVYGGYFDRDRHAQPLTMNPALPLVESWDYGFHHPCVIWLQFTPWGGLHLLGGVMGEDIYIEDFAPIALQQRAQWFKDPLRIDACADPAGEKPNSQGTNKTGLDVLQDALGYKPIALQNSNAPEMRDNAIQTIAGYLRRRGLHDTEAFRIDPRQWLVISQRDARAVPFAVDGLEAGYVWDQRVVRSSRGKSIQVPLKDRFYEHSMNTLEYAVLNFGPAMPAQVDQRKLERELVRRAQIDVDPDDLPRRPGSRIGGFKTFKRGRLNRGGY
jgi:hypothetical protein